jgi:hypothetical protein
MSGRFAPSFQTFNALILMPRLNQFITLFAEPKSLKKKICVLKYFIIPISTTELGEICSRKFNFMIYWDLLQIFGVKIVRSQTGYSVFFMMQKGLHIIQVAKVPVVLRPGRKEKGRPLCCK